MNRRMHIEIERKFNLKSMPNVDPDEIVKIDQWYWKNNGIWEGASTWFSDVDGNKWMHTIKKSVSKGVNIEDEKDLTLDEYNRFIETCQMPGSESRFISKERHIYKDGDLKWEVDKFDDIYLIIAEIEIPKKNHPIVFPDYISDLVLLQVTGLK